MKGFLAFLIVAVAIVVGAFISGSLQSTVGSLIIAFIVGLIGGSAAYIIVAGYEE